MKCAILVAVLFSYVLTSAQGFALKSAESSLLNKCQEKQIEKLFNKIITDTLDLKEEAIEAYQNTFDGVVDCVENSFSTVVSCVEETVTENVEDFSSELETYITTVQTLAQKLQKAIQNCV